MLGMQHASASLMHTRECGTYSEHPHLALGILRVKKATCPACALISMPKKKIAARLKIFAKPSTA